MVQLFSQTKTHSNEIPETIGSFFLFIGILLFFLTVAAYGGLAILTKSQENTAQTLKDEIAQKQAEIRPEFITQITTLEKRLKNMRELLNGHTAVSNIFQMLEADTHPRVQFNNFSFSAAGRRVDMDGLAASYTVIAQQVSIFEQEPQIERVEFGGLSATKDNFINFKISLIIRPSLLKFQLIP
ncbi:MAG: hypothetical protein G01um101433_937 [Parcubacteria group bacterium Gr01-1014_33]|nr:MAG: hypothetical protein G01um101433_937 [Parcubacteria group bacterium Gr01-1014_33]